MKRLMKKSIVFILSAALLLCSCHRTLPTLDSVYFTGSEDNELAVLYLDGATVQNVTVSSSVKVDQDVTVTVKVDQEAMENLNKLRGTSYVVLPENAYSLSTTEVTIKAGSAVSTPVTVSIPDPSVLVEGTHYCLPLSVESTSTGMNVLEVSKHKFLTVSQIISTKAALTGNPGGGYSGNNYFAVPSMVLNESFYDMGQCTMECRVKMHEFYPASHNPGIATVMGQEEKFLIRFGDISCDNDQIQIAGRGKSLTSKSHFSKDVWYHVAAVDDGNTITLYVNGEVEGVESSKGKGAINLGWDWEGGFCIGNSCGNRIMNGELSEVRVWQRALSVAELKANTCYVDPASEGLVIYWRFDKQEADGSIKDVTGHGHSAVPAGPVSFVDIKCPDL